MGRAGRTRPETMKSLEKCENCFGPLQPELIKRIKRFIKSPTNKTWDDIHGILITPGKTIWQAVIELDPTFPKVGRTTLKRKVIQDWSRIPTPLQVLQAIKRATN